MRRNGIIILLLVVLSVLSACSDQEKLQVETAAEKPSRKQEEPPEMTALEKAKSDFLDKVKPGMSEEEVRSIYGTGFKLLKNAMDGNETWRYDIKAKEGYRFDDQGIDQVDLQGLKDGLLEQILFIDWTGDGRLKSAALFLTNQDRSAFIEYRIHPDGKFEEHTTEFSP